MGHIEKTAADRSALGFEYQDLVLVDILVGLKAGESIGLAKKKGTDLFSDKPEIARRIARFEHNISLHR